MATAALGASVVAVCYGFGRYAFGLFLPEIGQELSLSPAALGFLGGVSTAGYGVGLLAVDALTRRSGRSAAVISAALATVGLLMMAVAPTSVVLGAGLFVAGSSAGVVSPAIAVVIMRTVAASERPAAQTWANTGTGFGLAASAFTPLLGWDWRIVWAGFSALAVLAGVVILLGLAHDRGNGRAATSPSGEVTAQHAGARGLLAHAAAPGMRRLLVSALLLGVVSAPYWTFSVERVRDGDTGAGLTTAWFWTMIGVGGLLGGLGGGLTRRWGLRRVVLTSWVLMAGALALLGLPTAALPIALLSAGCFGAAYMGLTGLCIVWSERVWRGDPGVGVVLAFLAVGVGQTVGSPLAGLLVDPFGGLPPVFLVSAAATGLVWWTRPRSEGDRGSRAAG